MCVELLIFYSVCNMREYSWCPGYQAKGYCKLLKTWMKRNCPRACGYCPTPPATPTPTPTPTPTSTPTGVLKGFCNSTIK